MGMFFPLNKLFLLWAKQYFTQIHSVTDVTIFRVVAGEHDLSVVSGLEQNRDVRSYKMHENYNSNTQENDIALIYVRNKNKLLKVLLLNSTSVSWPLLWTWALHLPRLLLCQLLFSTHQREPSSPSVDGAPPA